MFKTIIFLFITLWLQITADKCIPETKNCDKPKMCRLMTIVDHHLGAMNTDLKLQIESQFVNLRERKKLHIEELSQTLDHFKQMIEDDSAKLLVKFKAALDLLKVDTPPPPEEWPVIRTPSNCSEWLEDKSRPSGVYRIKPNQGDKWYFVYCLRETDAWGTTFAWTVIQRRVDGSVNFNVPKENYYKGFGKIPGEFFLGLEGIRALTLSGYNELWVQVENFDGEQRWSKHDDFRIDSVKNDYKMTHIGFRSGTAWDGMQTYLKSCKGGWWFYAGCDHSGLNGPYRQRGQHNVANGKGVTWYGWPGKNISLKFAQMALRHNQV